jgi:arylsulfatase A-like enzyme
VEAPEEDVAKFRGRFEEGDPVKAFNAAYAAMITRLDKEIGRVLKALDARKLAGSTLVIFTSDHGATFERGSEGAPVYHDSNRPFRGHKRTLWEGGIRVPAVVRWPGKVPSGRTSSEIVHMTDVFPSLLAAAGSESAPNVDGRNLLTVWEGKERAPERTLFWEWRTEGYNQLAAMRGDLKLVITGSTAPELYDVEKDPSERITIAADHQSLVQQLRRELTAWSATESESAKWGKTR